MSSRKSMRLIGLFASHRDADLLKSAARRVVDRRVLHLIKMWLECPVEETDQGTPTGIRHRFSGIRHRFLSAVSGAQSGGFARFATRLNPLTPCFVTGKIFCA
jgi:hypothetical protein